MGNDIRYLLLITDLVIQAIELEVLSDMTTEKLMHAHRRIVARRIQLMFHISDNAKQFQLLAQTLSTSVMFRNYATCKFLPEHSPWQGGTYERLIALTKKSLYRTFNGVA